VIFYGLLFWLLVAGLILLFHSLDFGGPEVAG
jgi:hypothetical protein